MGSFQPFGSESTISILTSHRELFSTALFRCLSPAREPNVPFSQLAQSVCGLGSSRGCTGGHGVQLAGQAGHGQAVNGPSPSCNRGESGIASLSGLKNAKVPCPTLGTKLWGEE